MDKKLIDRTAEMEGIALGKQRRRNRLRYINRQTSTYNEQQFSKLFRKNRFSFCNY